jgi:hypothetical protein
MSTISGVTSGERHDLCLADHRDGLEVEAVECLARRQPGFGEVAFEPAPAALGNLMLRPMLSGSGRPASLPCRLEPAAGMHATLSWREMDSVSRPPSENSAPALSIWD